MAKVKALWVCSSCGHKEHKWVGCCPSCGTWNSLEEMLPEPADSSRRFSFTAEKTSQPLRLDQVPLASYLRIPTKMNELDRILGGGIVKGALMLLAGDPGIGKSTLMLQIAQTLSSQGLVVLYVCGEESIEQTSLRAKRLNITSDKLYLLNETLFSNVKHHIEHIKPDILIVDSVQILYKSELPSAPGSVVQVREIATELMHLSKGMNVATFLIGHVTKSGEIAGPRVLEHLVDVVLEFEGDRQHGFRMLRGIKNRFGPTDDVAVFQMQEVGLREVLSPSEAFLQERHHHISGSVIIPTLEGSRPILVEVQALVASSSFATSTRRATGIDQNRLALLLAVLEKRMSYPLYNCDVFVSVAGGLKILEPGVDLGVLLAISSSFCNRILDPNLVVIGEVGLGGEVRSVSRIEQRIKEAIHMGFKKCVVPKRNLAGLGKELFQKIEILGVDRVEEAINECIR